MPEVLHDLSEAGHAASCESLRRASVRSDPKFYSPRYQMPLEVTWGIHKKR